MVSYDKSNFGGEIMIKWIDIKDTFRNKRFVLFTILFPVFYYLLFINIYKNMPANGFKTGFVWFVISCIIGVAGNSVITFSKKINGTQEFYRLQAKISNYKMANWLSDQSLIQALLNFFICAVIMIAGLITQTLKVNLDLVWITLLIILLGMYLSIVGFFIGILFDGQTIAALSSVLSIVNVILLVPWEQITLIKGLVMTVLTTIQKLFPGIYIFEIVQKMENNQPWLDSLGKFILSFGLILLPIAVFLFSQRTKKVKAKSNLVDNYNPSN